MRPTSTEFVPTPALLAITLLMLGWAFAMGLVTYSAPTQAASARTSAPPWGALRSQEAWLQFAERERPGRTWATNISDYENTTLNVVYDSEHNCQPRITLFVNKVNLGGKTWAMHFDKIIVRIDGMPSLHMGALAYYQPGALILDFSGNKALMLDMIRLGKKLTIHLNADKYEFGTLHTRFTLAGAEQAVATSRSQCLEEQRGFRGSLSDLKL
ncbi:MAG: hypothetical protein AWU57_578 [Marinobacter sp. T13-3]|nr:MAG: hypothetical protein AWU57_578 [Marinobacter sp. T13-3]